MENNFINQIYYGDNLDVMTEKIPNNSIDLIYLDPPFNSNRNYNQIYSTNTGLPVPEEAIAFCDAWELTEDKLDQIKIFANELEAEDDNREFADFWNAWVKALEYQNPKILSYLVFMARRLRIMRYKLKNTGSLFLHCDTTASHYIKIILDGIFGHKNFRNEIIWQRTNAHNDTRKKFSRVSDSIFFYTKTDNYKFYPIKISLDEEYIKKNYKNKDERGLYASVCLTGPGTTKGKSSVEWKGYNPTLVGRHWAIPNEIIKKIVGEEEDKLKTLNTIDKLNLLYENDYILFSSNGVPRLKQYMDNSKGMVLGNIWTDIKSVPSQSKERLGYPTQKPIELLERIIKSTTKEGGIVMDPFCGCGTTLDAAQNLKRHWIGIDICMLSANLIENRLTNKYKLLKRGVNYKIDGIPVTMEQVQELIHKSDTSKNEGKYQFQYWAVEKVDGFASTKKSGDGGIDGAIYFYKDEKKTLGRMVLSVKGGKTVGVSMIRDLIGTMQNNQADMAGFICYAKPTKDMLLEASKVGYFKLKDGLFADVQYPRVQILTAEEILQGKKFNLPYTRLLKKS